MGDNNLIRETIWDSRQPIKPIPIPSGLVGWDSLDSNNKFDEINKEIENIKSELRNINLKIDKINEKLRVN